jgi:hypothetical protein
MYSSPWPDDAVAETSRPERHKPRVPMIAFRR